MKLIQTTQPDNSSKQLKGSVLKIVLFFLILTIIME